MVKIDFDIIDSTNKYLKENHLKYEDFTFVSASKQTSGKGREQRKWLSNYGENLLFSFLIKNESLVEKYSYISILTAYSIIKVLETIGIQNAMIKWPNDIYVNDKKICGILLEGNIPNYLVVGVGLNVNQTQFDGEYRTTPTSIKKEINNNFDINDLKQKIYQNIENELIHLSNNDFSFMNSVTKYDYLKDKSCSLTMYKPNRTVHIIGIQTDSSLLINDEGKNISISSGEIVDIKYQ